MKHIIVGTAGHIDHGKTTLIKALTGRNTDRWEEEQKRGITIDLGFTYFDLPGGNRVGIIDVPGHEDFINNMVAGVVGMDLVLLVIAADEGIMPQTREHMDILSLLGIQKSIVVLNKCDLVDEEWKELVKEEIAEELEGTFLENAPLVEVSSVTGKGLDILVDLIEKLTQEEVEEKDNNTIPRLPIDRVFTISGFGTIITGTLISGKIRKGETLCVYPLEKECKIRSIQVHGGSEDVCYAGQRVALNLSNLKKEELHRGCVIAPENSMHNTRYVVTRLKVLGSSQRVITNQMRLHLFTGTSEILCRAILLDQEELGPGESGYVQLRLEEPTALRKGDRFVVRFYSPLETIAGGEVLEPNPSREKRFAANVIEGLNQKESGTLTDVLELHIRQAADLSMTEKELAKLSGTTLEEVREATEELVREGTVNKYETQKETFFWDASKESSRIGDIKAALMTCHKKYPYRPGLRKEEVRSGFLKQVKPALYDQVLTEWEKRGAIKKVNEYLSLPDYEIPEDDTYRKITETIEKQLIQAGYNFVWFTDLELPFTKMNKGDAFQAKSSTRIEDTTVDDILTLMVSRGVVVKVADNLYTMARLMEEAKNKVTEKLNADGLITIAEVRDMFSTSRKSAKPILEYLDAIHVTRKAGAESERVPYK